MLRLDRAGVVRTVDLRHNACAGAWMLRLFSKRMGSKSRKRAEILQKEEAVKMLENSREREAAE